MHPTLLLLLLVACLLLLHLPGRVSADCEPAACGNLTLRYPFWLGSGNQTLSPCGHPAFEVWCSDGGSVASLKGSSIHVLAIDYANSSFIASHSRVAAGDDGVCRTDFNMSVSIAMSPFTISSQNCALCFLYSCDGTEPSGPEYVNATSTMCAAPIYAYLGGTYYWDKPPEIATGRCTYTYFPVLGREAAAMTAANYSRLLKDGFVLEWEAAGIGDCATCNASGGQCRYDNTAGAFRCLCPDGGRAAGSTCAAQVQQQRRVPEQIHLPGVSGGEHLPQEPIPTCGGHQPAARHRLPRADVQRLDRRPATLLQQGQQRAALPREVPGAFAGSSGRVPQPALRQPVLVRLGDGGDFSRQRVQGGVPPGCLFSFVPILGALDGNGDGYIAGMKNGFLLEWTEVPGDCPECIASGGECVYGGETGLTFACKCSGSLRPEKCDEFRGIKNTLRFCFYLGQRRTSD
ncbi:hypothetical protein C2845_PM07G03530 [Panicum miliaceum]|uniref:Uncharacterized protein n=1 Tax=Panicum miliaceum TaxID=4540 RepID=A0A3L6SQL6_PANMI|nr:hypothetical protein C2845_PM07G03530 [Panicum miliaceum]